MEVARARTQDGVMNETPPQADAGFDPHGFDPHRVRGITDVKRSSDDRMVAGVCTGVARYLNIDPVILRVILVALTFIGFAGVFLYAGAWLLLPADDQPRSIVASWFKLDDNEEQVRIIGLIITGVLAITAGTGIFNGDWNAPFPWFGLIAFAGLYFWVIRPAQRRREQTVSTPLATQTADGQTVTQVLRPPKEPRTPWSPILTLTTLSTSLIAMGGIAIYADANSGVPWTTYAVTALGVVGLGILIGTFWGNAGPLVPIGAIVAIVLAVTSLLPSSRIGHDIFPESSTAVASSYKLGIGELELDLNELSNPAQLNGRTITVKVGVGQTRIVVPTSTNVEVRSKLHAGEIAVFGRKANGTENKLTYPADDPSAPKLTLIVSQTFGNLEVIKQ